MMESEKKMLTNPFARLGLLARSVGTGAVSRAVDAVGERRAADAFTNRTQTPGIKRFFGFSVVFATAVTALAVFTLQIAAHEVSWTVDGRAAREGAYISPVSQDATVRFSEGTEFTVQQGSRLRVAEAGKKTVKAVLEVGASRIRVASGSPVSWKIDAGPFSVTPGAVASLMVEWLADELLRVSIFEGETSLLGTPSPLSLHAGQQVSANARDGSVEVRPLSSAPAMSSAATAEIRNELPPPPPASDEPTVAVLPAPSSTSSVRRISWSDSVAAGDYAVVVREAERRGIAQVLADATLADLAAVADAARLSGRIDLSKRALTAERNRFARSTAARDAAFFLGRIADDHEHALASAIGWYDTYLLEAPHGSFSTEAFGRKMVAVSKQSGRAAALPLAAEYLKRFPNGPHAALAHDLSNQ
jgi:hypothetical protein